MPGFNPENINIHDLTIEEPEQKEEGFFDPEKEVTERDWEGIWEMFENEKRGGYWREVVGMGANIKIVDPGADLGITPEDWGNMKRLFSDCLSRADLYGAAIRGAEMKIIDPQVELGLDQVLYKRMEEDLESKGRGSWEFGFWTSFFDMAERLKILFPHNHFDPSKYVAGKRETNLEKELSEKKEKGDDYFFSALAGMRIAGYDPGFDNDDLHYDRKVLDRHRTARIIQSGQPDRIGRWDALIEVSASLKILAAEKVEVTDGGLEIIMPKSLQSETTPNIPEGRKF